MTRDTQQKEEIRLFNDPASLVRFLQLAFDGEQWQARLLFPVNAPSAEQHFQQVTHSLKAAGLAFQEQTDAAGNRHLMISDLGEKPDILEVFRAHGLISGSAKVLTRPFMSMESLASHAGKLVSQAGYYLKDPARANGVFFLSAEAFLTAAMWGAKDGKWTDLKSMLLGVSGMLFASQSAAYMFWAKPGDERIVKDWQQQMQGSAANLDQALDRLSVAEPLNNRPSQNMLEAGRRVLEDHPIQSGAMMNNLGMLTYMGHALLERRFQKAVLAKGHSQRAEDYLQKGFGYDMRGGLVSLLGWSSLLPRPKEYEEKSGNPALFAWQSYRENPQYVSGACSLYSSIQRLMGAGVRQNNLQRIGEALYIPGDILLFFIKNNDYGASRSGDIGKLVNKVAEQVDGLPFIMGPQAQQDVFDRTANYLARQHVALAQQVNPDTSFEIPELYEQFRLKLRDCCASSLTSRFSSLALAAADIIASFPEAEREQVTVRLSDALSYMPPIAATSEEIREEIAAQTARHPLRNIQAQEDRALAPLIGRLARQLDDRHAGNAALAIYDALTPLRSNEKHQRLTEPPRSASDWMARISESRSSAAQRAGDATPGVS